MLVRRRCGATVSGCSRSVFAQSCSRMTSESSSRGRSPWGPLPWLSQKPDAWPLVGVSGHPRSRKSIRSLALAMATFAVSWFPLASRHSAWTRLRKPPRQYWLHVPMVWYLAIPSSAADSASATRPWRAGALRAWPEHPGDRAGQPCPRGPRQPESRPRPHRVRLRVAAPRPAPSGRGLVRKATLLARNVRKLDRPDFAPDLTMARPWPRSPCPGLLLARRGPAFGLPSSGLQESIAASVQ